MKSLRITFAIVAAIELAACATTSFERTTTIQSGTEVAGASVVVYSFLDVRKDFFGEQMLAMMHSQLEDQLKTRGVNARVVVYKHTARETDFTSLLMGMNRNVVSVPIKTYMLSQRPEEEKRGDKYRLMVFPSMVTTTGANIDSQINWTLIDTKTDKPVWTTSQNTSRTIWWNNDEAPETRSKQFVDGVLTQMASSGLFGAAAKDQLEQQQRQQQLEKEKNKPQTAM
jgi:hypothetical protein